MRDTTFIDLILERGSKRVVWEYIDEGFSGDYNEKDPTDQPLLRFSCYEYSIGSITDNVVAEWVQMDDASYCTRIPVGASTRSLARLAAVILDVIQEPDYKKRLEELSWLGPEDVGNVVPLME